MDPLAPPPKPEELDARASRPVLERWGVRYFRELSRGVAIVDLDGVHFLNAQERAGLRGVVRGAVARAAVAGALSTVVSAAAEVMATPLIAVTAAGESPAPAMVIRFWVIVIGATTLASIIEIGFLYWDGLRAVHRMAVVAGLDLFGNPVRESQADHPDGPSWRERNAVAEALARAALELPNPGGRVFGVNPRRDASRFQLAMASVVYKLKISVTNFVVKALVRRAIGRTALRGWLNLLVPFAAVPVTAAWNAIVAWLVLREARIRTMGPSAANQLAGRVLEGAPKGSAWSLEGRHAIVRAVACSIVRTEDLHPNLVALLETVARELGVAPASDLDDPARFVALLAELPPAEQRPTLQMLCVAAVLDGRISRKERLLILESFAACSRSADLGALNRLRRAFVRGDKLEQALIDALA